MSNQNDQTESLEFELPEPEEQTEEESDGLAGDEKEVSEGESPQSPPDDEEIDTEEPVPASQDQATPEQYAEWLRSQGYQVSAPEPEEGAFDETDFFIDPQAALAKERDAVRKEILAELDPVIRPTAIAQAKASLDALTNAIGLDLDAGLRSQMEADLMQTPTELIQRFANDPTMWTREIAARRAQGQGKPKTQARPSITSGVQGESKGGVTRVTLTKTEAAEWAAWAKAFGDNQESKREFIKAHRGEA